MLTIKCAACNTKLFRYRKIGQGKVLRCHKARIKRIWNMPVITPEGDVLCPACGRLIARDAGRHFDMIKSGFTYTGTKENL